jgi:hypothetical protein
VDPQTSLRACASLAETDSNYCYSPRGYGLSADDGATITVDDVAIVDSAEVGLQLTRGATLLGRELRIHRSPVAANLQECPGSYDFEAAVEELLVQSCEIEIDESEMSVPELLPE